MAALLDLKFENAVELTPEQIASNAAYFKAEGYGEIEVKSEGDPPPTEKPTESAAPAADPAVVVDDKAAPVVDEIDAETQAEWSASNDGERKGKYAKRTAKLRELEKANQEKDAKLAEILKQLEAKTTTVTTPLAAPEPKADPPAETKTEAPKANEFSEARPALPKYADFMDADDPISAHADAVAKHSEDLFEWGERKREFEGSERDRVASELRKQEQATTAELTRSRTIDEKFKAIRTERPDFDEITGKAKYTGMLNGILLEEEDDGLTLGYELAKPEHADTLAILNHITDVPKGADNAVQVAAFKKAIRSLAVFREQLKATPTPAEKTPAAETKPVPSDTPPRREEAAPVPVRGRTATPAQRLEDIDPSNIDAIREFHRKNNTPGLVY